MSFGKSVLSMNKQAMSQRPHHEARQEAKELLYGNSVAFLSTHSVQVEGFPFGSLIGYAMDGLGAPYFLMSGLAQHSKNIQEDNRVSLMLGHLNEDHPQSQPRLTLLGRAWPAEGQKGHRYFRLFPEALEWKGMGFEFYRVEIQEAQFIGGFGDVHWLSGQELRIKNRFEEEQEEGFIESIPEELLAGLAKRFGEKELLAIGMDQEGVHFLGPQQKRRIFFQSPAETLESAMEELIALSGARG